VGPCSLSWRPLLNPRLTIELVPSTCWFSNVRSEVSAQTWNRLKQATFSAARHRCEICDGRGPKWPVECHEVWSYIEIPETDHIEEQRIQKLEHLIALCPACHQVKHIGLSMHRGLLSAALDHLARVNGWTVEDAGAYVEHIFEIWARRSAHDWTLDISYLRNLDVVIEKEKKVA
jgi:hypothetical protein